MYNRSYPLAINYGRIAWVLGHEIGHGLDNDGVHWAFNGSYIKDSLLDEQSRKGFASMSRCLIEEYDQFVFNASGSVYHVNGRQTLGENIADNGGERSE